MPDADRCQVCGGPGPARQTKFYQNIGMLVARRMATLDAAMCKPCVHRSYWKMTGITLAVGWLGTISVILAPILVIMNTVTYLSRMGMPKPGTLSA